MVTGAPTQRLWGAVVVTVAVPAFQVIAPIVKGPPTLTVMSASGVNPTAPLYVNAGVAAPPLPAVYAPTSLAPSVVAGSPGIKVPENTVLKTLGYSVPELALREPSVLPAAMSARPDSGPNENM